MSVGKAVASTFIQSGLLSLAERMEQEQPNVLRILVYHRLGMPESETGQFDPGLINSTPTMFAEQMAYLKEHYHPLSLADLIAALETGESIPPRSVMVTFDDNYRSFLSTAWPTLEALSIPAILFVATDFSTNHNQLFWWDKLYQAVERTESVSIEKAELGQLSLTNQHERHVALKAMKELIRSQEHHEAMATVDDILGQLNVAPDESNAMLTWDELAELNRKGLYIGAHTQSHPLLNQLSINEAIDEIVSSQAELQARLPDTWPVFAYPFGNDRAIRSELIPHVAEAGFKVAMTMHEGHNVIGKNNPLWLKRLGMAPHLSLDEFRLVLTRIYNVYGSMSKLQAKLGI